ncbi:MAG: hypothetical protein J0H39_16300 [Alphaproteobacteria bacterium]|nr:hypothetical protein [Alphaproteobacteria bacterium]
MVERTSLLAFQPIGGGLPDRLPTRRARPRPKLQTAAHQPRGFGIGGKGRELILPQIEITLRERFQAWRFVVFIGGHAGATIGAIARRAQALTRAGKLSS